MRARILFDPKYNPNGLLIEEALGQMIAEVREKQERAREAGVTAGARESALVVTKLEEALLWQIRRGQVAGRARVSVDDPRGGFTDDEAGVLREVIW